MSGSQAGSRRTALFDFDGTLADSLAAMLAIYNELAGQLEVVQVGPERAEELRKLGPRGVMCELGIPLWKAPRILGAVRRTLRERDHVPAPFAGVQAALERLAASGVRTGVLSSNTAPNVRAFLARHGFTSPEIVSTGVSLFGKAARLQNVIQRHRLLAADVVYVGDEVRDIEACRAAGVRSVAVSWGYGERSALLRAAPDALVDAPEELVALLGL
jgi:phosphoglycolate phosphatase